MANVTPEMFGEGHAVAIAALDGREVPPQAITPKPLVASSSTSLYAAFAPELAGEYLYHF